MYKPSEFEENEIRRLWSGISDEIYYTINKKNDLFVLRRAYKKHFGGELSKKYINLYLESLYDNLKYAETKKKAHFNAIFETGCQISLDRLIEDYEIEERERFRRTI